MTPREKAKELFDKYQDAGIQWYIDTTKKYVLIAVDEIVDLLPNINLIPPIERKPDEFYAQYWYSVKREIQLL